MPLLSVMSADPEGTKKNDESAVVHKQVARLSISTDLERRDVVSMIKNTIGDPNNEALQSAANQGVETTRPKNEKRRRRRSSVQTATITKKKRELKPTEVIIDPRPITKKLTISDLRDLVLFTFNELPSNIRWLNISNRLNIKKVVILFIPGLSGADFGVPDLADQIKPIPMHTLQYSTHLSIFGDFFKYLWPTKSPGSKVKLYSTYLSLVSVPLNKTEKKNQQLKKKPLKITIHDLLMTAEEMIENGYPLHSFYQEQLTDDQKKQAQAIDEKFDAANWVETKPFKHEGSKTFAIDCEMCLSNGVSVLTRVSLINFNDEVLLDELVKPKQQITDYVTKYSGITEGLLKDVNTTLEDVQTKILSIVSADDVLIGHSLESDLKVLKMKHKNIVDTALIYDHSQGYPFKPSLKWLVQKHLKRDIQNDSNGHDSVEDAKACMDLVKLKIQKGLEFGKFRISSIDIFTKINSKVLKKYLDNAEDARELDVDESKKKSLEDKLRKSLSVDYSRPLKLLASSLKLQIGEKVQCFDDDSVIKLLTENVNNYDLILGRIREAEYATGWSLKPEEVPKSEENNAAATASEVSAASASKSPNDGDTKTVQNSNKSLTNGITENCATSGDDVDSNKENNTDSSVSAEPEATVENKIKLSSEPLPTDPEEVYKNVARKLKTVIDSLPNQTLLIVNTFNGDPREMRRLQKQKKEFQDNFGSERAEQVRWTAYDEDDLKNALEEARDCLSFIGLKNETSYSGVDISNTANNDTIAISEDSENAVSE